MKKIFMLCLAGALALASTACDDKDDKGGGNSGKITINGQTENVNSAFYISDDGYIALFLLKDVLTEIPEDGDDPDFGISIEFSESLLGKTIDLTNPLDPDLRLIIFGINKKTEIGIYYNDGTITDGKDDALTVSAGTLTLTRSGDNFTVELSVTLSDGSSLAAEWKGKVTKSDLELT